MKSLLYVRSHYSLLSSMCSLEGIISKCKEYNYEACALVDKNVLSGAMAFKKVCEKAHIKPIFGLEFSLIYEDRNIDCILYAKNDEGFSNLMKLSSHIMTSDNKVVSIDILNKYRDNNILALMSDSSPLSFAIEKNEDIDKVLRVQKELFKDYVYALVNHDVAYNKNRDDKLKEILVRNKIFYFGLSKIYYLNKDDEENYEILKCIRDKRTISDTNNHYEVNRHFLSKEEYSTLYSKDEIDNIDSLASVLNVQLDYKTELPEYKTKDGSSSIDYLVNLCKVGLKVRLNGNISESYQKRLEYELSVIIKMHFENYFLIVYDFILYAKKNNILVGPGRGSCAGSLVAYCLGITDIDPMKYGLLFERFLNPERISMPDIDTDFPDDKRDEVVSYVKNKYGSDHVGHIITFGTLKAKQVLRDVARVLEYPVSYVDALNKLVPFDPNGTLQKVYDTVPLFRQRIESEEKYRRLYNISLKLEGAPRNESTHAAGIVFSKKNLTDVIPITRIDSDLYSTQYTAEHLEEMGLIKMDFLGLKNLSIIAEIVQDINKKEPFDLKKIPLDDPKTFKLIDDVNLLGVFQLESSGMMSLARNMKPKTFEELSMMIALFRPGPMENIGEFLNNRANPNRITYLHPALKPILAETYGIIVYQEQIMTIARVLAGFSYGKADVLRRAMSKKKADELEKLSDEFIKGCETNGIKHEVALELYELILKFANYGFNKSHSIAYGLVAYEMAYLKANYPSYFYKALLNGTVGSQSKTYDYLMEAQSVGLKIKPISINNSLNEYIIKDDSLLMPLGICEGVGSVGVSKILEERSKGLFNDYLDTVVRLTNIGVDKKALENLVCAGAFDGFKMSRFSMIKNLEKCISYAQVYSKMSLDLNFDDKPKLEEYPDNKMVLAEREKEVYGFYLTYNPIKEIKIFYKINTPSLRSLIEYRGPCKGFGLFKTIKRHKTKNGQMMAFVDIYDDTGSFSLVIMPDLYASYQLKLHENVYIYFEGNVDKEGSCLVKKLSIKEIENV